MTNKYIVVDLETTGNSYEKGERIIQIAAVKIENRKIIETFSTYVNPGVKIPFFIEDLTQINDQMLKDAPSFTEIAYDLKQFLEDGIFVAHNVPFDLGFLYQAFEAVGIDCQITYAIDTVELAKILLPTSTSFKLMDLSEKLALVHENPHRADSDALATAKMLLFFIDKLEKLPLVTVESLAKLGVYLKSDIAYFLQTIIEKKRRKIEALPADIEVFRGIALKKQVITDKNQQPEMAYPFSEEEKEQFLQSDRTTYEHRSGQMEMMDTIYDAFTVQKHALIEAGTGTGKTLAYLVPALFTSLKHKVPVIVSTYTIQMQEQIESELNKIKQIVPYPFQSTVLKGRSHYLSLFKFEQTLKEQDQLYETNVIKMQILVWLTETETGDIEELNISGGAKRYKDRIKHDGWYISKEKDPWISRDFYLLARKLAHQSEIVITNHAMVLIDIEKEGELLPETPYIIVDEAHNFRKVLSQNGKQKIEFYTIKYLLNRLGNLDYTSLLLKFSRIVCSIKEQNRTVFKQINETITMFEFELDDLFQLLSQILVQSKNNQSHYPRIRLQVNEQMIQSQQFQSFIMCMERVRDFHSLILQKLEENLMLCKQENAFTDEQYIIIEEVNSFVNDFSRLGEQFRTFIKYYDELYIWLEGDHRTLPQSVGIFFEQTEQDQKLANHFLANKKSVVFTSATLTVNQSFEYFMQELSLYKGELILKQIASPFDYKNRVKLLIPNDLPDIKQTNQQDFVAAIAGHIVGIAEATDGRMLVLFTSYEMLRQTYELIKESEELSEFMLMAQGITNGSRERLKKSFQQFNKAILFGTDSFWEGVDIPGKDLSCLVMVRLPFTAPDDPISAAKLEKIRKEGKNTFSTFSLPEAVIRFRQGFGRLIRRETDKGVVVVLDRRIDTTTYGKVFLQSLPKVTIERGHLNQIISSIESWL